MNYLHQFEVTPIIPLSFLGWDVSFTNSALFMLSGAVILMVFMHVAIRREAMAPGRLQASAELFYSFVANLMEGVAGREAEVYFPYIFSLFGFVLMGNMLGLLPYGFTFTSHIIVTFFLALLVFVSVICIGLKHHGLKFFRLFWPEGLPWYVAPILIPVEVMSFLAKPVSLGVRLFANMVSGGMMLKVFSSFVVMLGVSIKFAPLAVVVFGVNVILLGLKVLIGFLQAFVFATLTCIYLSDVLHLH